MVFGGINNEAKGHFGFLGSYVEKVHPNNVNVPRAKKIVVVKVENIRRVGIYEIKILPPAVSLMISTVLYLQ